MFTDWDDGAYEQEIITTALDCPEALMNINRGHALNLQIRYLPNLFYVKNIIDK